MHSVVASGNAGEVVFADLAAFWFSATNSAHVACNRVTMTATIDGSNVSISEGKLGPLTIKGTSDVVLSRTSVGGVNTNAIYVGTGSTVTITGAGSTIAPSSPWRS